MEELQHKYISVSTSSQGYLYCSGDSLSYSFDFRADKNRSCDLIIKEIYRHFISKLDLSLREIDTNFELENNLDDIQFLNYNFDLHRNGFIHFEFDIPFIWFNYLNNNFSQIELPRGCKLSVYLNDKLDVPINIVLKLYFNLFSNNLLSVATYGKNEKELYYFKPAARVNRAIVRNAIIEIKLKYPDVIIEFSNEIGWFNNFDEYGFTEKTDFVFD